ncbi:hypothetical protein [Flavobacterium macacae]|uniref:Uncharacterized protein n=1 Tax=Flavobacterium macacae TaxID=2488993 RepID=A0A3P3W6I6_9FLAO|nr:hypothetical protein [Flavobacterium macacae]RRJ90801.1 hypothetical protein EG849_10025 [Flavobacterium macacae]
MEKESVVERLIEAGYTTNFTLDKDCLYCSNTCNTYMLTSFDVDQETGFTEDGVIKKIRAVSSQEYGIKGYYLF